MSGLLVPTLGVGAGALFYAAVALDPVFIVAGTMLALWTIDAIVWNARK